MTSELLGFYRLTLILPNLPAYLRVSCSSAGTTSTRTMRRWKRWPRSFCIQGWWLLQRPWSSAWKISLPSVRPHHVSKRHIPVGQTSTQLLFGSQAELVETTAGRCQLCKCPHGSPRRCHSVQTQSVWIVSLFYGMFLQNIDFFCAHKGDACWQFRATS